MTRAVPGLATGASARPPAPVPALLLRDRGTTISRGDLLYRVYLVVVLGGMYGSVLVQALLVADVPRMGSDELALAGLLAALLPLAASLAGVRFGRWAGPVPVTSPEASILLPTPVDRRALLLPRLGRSYAASLGLGAVVGLLMVVLLALNYEVGATAWVLVPALVGAGALLGAGASAVAETSPQQGARHRRWTLGILGTAALVVVAGTQGWALLVELGAGLTGTTTGVAATGFLAVVAAVGVSIAVGGRGRIVAAHDEELRSRAGLHAGLAAAARLGDLRALSTSREATSRARRLTSPPYPNRGARAIAWRHLTVLRAAPAPLVRCATGWVAATLLVRSLPAEPSVPGLVLVAVLASVAIYLAITPLLEPLRREHDSPLAAELLPFGFAALSWMHVRAALLMATVIGFVATGFAAVVVGADATAMLLLVAAVPLAALTGVVAAADRVRQPGSIAEIMANLPAGATPEVLGFVLVGMFLRPLVAMLPLALPVGLALATTTPLLELETVGATVTVLVGVGTGVAMLAARFAGLRLWLQEYERSLLDAELLEPTNVLTLAWRRLRSDPEPGP